MMGYTEMRKTTLLMLVIWFVVGSSELQGQEVKTRIAVPDINGRATLLVKPDVSVSAEALAADSSTLTLKVIVDKTGSPTSAECSASCHPGMKAAAEKAAMASRFQPLIVRGEAVEYEGALIYAIAIQKINWFQFGTFLRSVHNFDNLTVSPVVQLLTNEFALERSRLADIDNEKNVNERIRKIGAEIEHFRKKLTGKDLWVFNAGLATRNVTFWPMAGERIDRDGLRGALKHLSVVAAAAPQEISKEFVAVLREISEFTFEDKLPEMELRQEIRKLGAKLKDYPR